MDNKYYTSEENVQILIALLKAHKIRKVIASPGTTNFTLVGSIQNDPYFEIYSSVDERSAAYIACGLSAESGEPVMLTCTGATASRNYYPGLTEAYYRKLPILAVTSHQGNDRIGQLVPQNIDRSNIPHDIASLSVAIPVVNNTRDADYATLQINKALLALRRNGGSPVHINMITTYSKDFSVRSLPDVKVYSRFHAWDTLPEMPKSRIGIYVGAHNRFSDSLTKAVDSFCAHHDAVVFCDHTSGYYGKYNVLPTLALFQKNSSYPLPILDLMIHIGGVSAASFAGLIKTRNIWRVNEDGEIRNPFKKLSYVFQMSEEYFFTHYAGNGKGNDSFLKECNDILEQYYAEMPELPFSNFWIARRLSPLIPKGSLFHISASHSRRAWNIFPFPKTVESMCNVGACGIDGCTSTLIGASLATPDRICYLVTGDLAFFYDLNVLGNRHIGKNVRILLINNGIGGEFKLSTHPCHVFGDEANKFMAAEGHFGCKSHNLVRHIAEDLGFHYLHAESKEEFINNIPAFTDVKIGDKSIIFEVFTSVKDENEALGLMDSIRSDMSSVAKQTAKQILGEKGVSKLKSLLGKK